MDSTALSARFVSMRSVSKQARAIKRRPDAELGDAGDDPSETTSDPPDPDPPSLST